MVLLALLLSGCGDDRGYVDSRVRFWRGELNDLFVIGEPIASAKQKGAALGIALTDPPVEASVFHAELERFESAAWYCDDVFVEVSVEVDTAGRVESVEVDAVAICL